MTFINNEEPSKAICLFHEITDCPCITPVKDIPTLIHRLTREISLNNLFDLCSVNKEEQNTRRKENEAFQKRLDELENS